MFKLIIVLNYMMFTTFSAQWQIICKQSEFHIT